MNKFREWISIKTVKAPGTIVLLVIFFANVAFIGVAAFIISRLAPPSMEDTGFWSYVFHTITLILGVGGVENLIEEIGEANVVYVLCCVIAIIIGLVVFTGAIIGYMSEFISSFIEEADSGSRKLHISNHIVILNWNTRAAEIVNELLYKNTKEKVVVLVENNRDDVLQDINERLSDTIEEENGIKNKLTIIVREGDSCSTKQLNDISIKRAKSVIILSNGIFMEKGDANTIKTLVQVVQLTAEEDSANNQQIIVEVEDDWTLALVNTIIEHKTQKGKCNIIPVAVEQILGQLFSQFSIMPELNRVYRRLFSNEGKAAFFAQIAANESLSEMEFVSKHLDNHLKSIPLAVMPDSDGVLHCYYMSDNEQNIHSTGSVPRNPDFKVVVNPDFEMPEKHVLILGHNSKSAAIMEGFNGFSGEWKKRDGSEVFDIIVVDDESNLAKQEHYTQYPFVKKVVAADIYEKDVICNTIDELIKAYKENVCIMILSNDTVDDEDIDADALTYLILVQDIINRRRTNDPGFDPKSVELIVEILNPRNYDVVSNYSTNNIVISNRYISKMIMQIGEEEALFDFYNDILTYDEADAEELFSKELYVKKVSAFFSMTPEPCTAADLIRAVWHASPDDNKAIVLGYFRSDGKMILFEGDQSLIRVALSGDDKVIVFSNH